MVLAICREFEVNENWLRNGAGEMFQPIPKNGLEMLAKDFSLASLSRFSSWRYNSTFSSSESSCISFEAGARFYRCSCQSYLVASCCYGLGLLYDLHLLFFKHCFRVVGIRFNYGWMFQGNTSFAKFGKQLHNKI